MKKASLMLVFGLLIVGGVPAQAFDKEEVSQPSTRYNPSPLTAVSVQSTAMFMDAAFESQLRSFQKLAAESEILKKDLTGFTRDLAFLDQQSGALSFHVEIPYEVDFLNGLNPQLRVGIMFMQYGALNYSISRSDQFRIDTLSGSSGSQFFVDSISNQFVDMSYTQEQLVIDAGLLIGSREDARWAVRGGISLSLGISTRAGTRIYYERVTELNLSSSNSINNSEFYSEEETFVNKAGWVGMASIPMILDFRIARKGNFFYRSHLYTEVRPFLYYTGISEINNQTQSGFSFGFGFRYEI